jgi:hypothetical protein
MEEETRLDLRTMGIKRWRLIAKDGTEWAGIVREAKACKGRKAREKKKKNNELTAQCTSLNSAFGLW